MSLVLPIFVDQYSGIWLSLHRDPIGYRQCLSLSKSLVSIAFSVPFHYISPCKFPKTLEMGNFKDTGVGGGECCVLIS